MIERKVTFNSETAAPSPRYLAAGMQGDNNSRLIRFDVPDLTADQIVVVKISVGDVKDEVRLYPDDDGMYCWTISHNVLQQFGDGGQVQLEVSDPNDPLDIVWQSGVIQLSIGASVDVDTTIVARETTLLTQIKAEMQRVEKATQASETAAKASETAAAASETAAKASADAAKTSESNAATSESNAASSAQASAASAETAATSEANAASSAAAALISAQNAASSETNAASSAAAALISAQASASSEQNAKASETAAKQSEQNALTSEQNAASSAATAKQSETAVKASETNALTGAQNALASEQNAAASAQAAAKGASDAKAYAAEAQAIAESDLDGVYLRKSEYTAEDVLAKLAAVDGDGSKLDADKLDGKNASEFAAASHTHAMSDVTGLTDTLDGKAAASHTHAASDVTGLTDTLDGKAAASHTHAASDITGLAETYGVTLAAASWSGGAYTIANPAFGADSKLIMALSESASAEQAEACRDAMIRVTAHAAGSITLTADGDAPTVDIPIDVIKLG